MRTVLITGGAKGIGLACTRRFAKDGHRVLITGRDREALDRATAEVPGVEALAFDVLDEKAWEPLRDRGIDILVANAGVAHSAPLHRTTLDDWNRIIGVNATGVFLAARAVLPHMRDQNWGDRKSTRLNSSHANISYAVFCLKK